MKNAIDLMRGLRIQQLAKPQNTTSRISWKSNIGNL